MPAGYNAWRFASLSPWPEWALVLFGLGATAAILLAARSLRHEPRRSRRVALLLLRAASAVLALFLLVEPAVQFLQTARVKSRLAVLRDTNDGFLVAQRDLELRGPGELLGTRQTGLPDYRIANLVRDADLLPRIQLAAESITRNSPTTAAAIVRRFAAAAQDLAPR